MPYTTSEYVGNNNQAGTSEEFNGRVVVKLLALVDPHHPTQHGRKFAVDFLRRFPHEVMTTDKWKKTQKRERCVTA
jgi:hypothetical protein